MNSLKREAKAVLQSLSTRPRKRLSQNFMVSDRALGQMIDALDLTASDTVLEIGPGLGFLTRGLSQKDGRVIAVEKDKRFCQYLTERFKLTSKVEVIESDILQFPFERYLKKKGQVKCIGNIPYQISSPLLDMMQKHSCFWSDILFTLQKAFAERLVAQPGSRFRSALSSWIQMHADVKLLKTFRPSDFYPRPRVDSVLVKIRFFEKPLYPHDNRESIYRCIHLAFQKRRKMLLNALKGLPLGLEKPALGQSLKKAFINPTSRPEDLSCEDWIRVGGVVHRHLE